MDFTCYDKEEYRNIPLFDISTNKNNLPFWTAKINVADRTLHRHKYIQIIYVTRGKLLHRVADEKMTASRGDVFVIPPYVPHKTFRIGEEPLEIIQFEFTPEFALDRCSSGGGDAAYPDSAFLGLVFSAEHRPCLRASLTGALRTSVEKLLDEILSEYQLREVNFGFAVKALTLELLVQLGRALSGGACAGQSGDIYLRHREAMIRALHFIQEHFSEDLSPDDAARVALLSTSYFRCLFRQMTSRTFTRYVNELRINKAIDLLKINPETHITDICYAVGFNNINYFNRIFKQVTGVSPRSYKTRDA